MVRSTEAVRWPLKDDYLAPLRHMIEDLSSENKNDILYILDSQWWCCMVASICPRACWHAGVCRRLQLLGQGHLVVAKTMQGGKRRVLHFSYTLAVVPYTVFH